MKNRQKQVSWQRVTNRAQSLISDPKSEHNNFMSPHSNKVTYELFET